MDKENERQLGHRVIVKEPFVSKMTITFFVFDFQLVNCIYFHFVSIAISAVLMSNCTCVLAFRLRELK